MLDGVLTSKQLATLDSPTRLMDREWAPCRYYCPVHADVRRYLELAAQGRWQESIDVIREALPFAAICGRICHHPCEANCRRQDVDKPVAIREIKRYLAELQGASGATVHKAASQDKARVAIVGGGPAGMSAALELAKRGYRPTVFEKFPFAGGVPATAIPSYRLPREVVQIDIDWICAHGVELVTGVEIGKDKSINQLHADGFEAVLVAAGLARSRMLNLPGADHARVRGVMAFLNDIALAQSIDIGQDVLVIGGGNVAVDGARSALRLGAAKVRMMCLEAEDEMPAWEWERTEAKEEGIEFINRRGPVEVVVRDGKIVGLKARKVTRVFDENRRFSPQYDDSDVIEIACDTVIMAIGQQADMGFLEGSGVKLDSRGRLEFTPATCQTNVPYVFACGEIVTPPGSAVEACFNGKRAAGAMDQFLSGKPIQLDDTLPATIGKIEPPVAEKVLPVARQPVLAQSAEARKRSWTPFESNLTEPATLCEARRCMSCGSGAEVLVDKCAGCLTCLRVCPFGVPRVADVATIESHLCQACGICIGECPNNAIVARGKAPDELAQQTLAKLTAARQSGDQRHVIAYICGHLADAATWKGSTDVAGVSEIYLSSLAGLSVQDMLGAIEQGAEAVLVIAAAPGRERYPQVNARLRARVSQARSLLQEIGLDGDKIKLLELA